MFKKLNEAIEVHKIKENVITLEEREIIENELIFGDAINILERDLRNNKFNRHFRGERLAKEKKRRAQYDREIQQLERIRAERRAGEARKASIRDTANTVVGLKEIISIEKKVGYGMTQLRSARNLSDAISQTKEKGMYIVGQTILLFPNVKDKGELNFVIADVHDVGWIIDTLRKTGVNNMKLANASYLGLQNYYDDKLNSMVVNWQKDDNPRTVHENLLDGKGAVDAEKQVVELKQQQKASSTKTDKADLGKKEEQLKLKLEAGD